MLLKHISLIPKSSYLFSQSLDLPSTTVRLQERGSRVAFRTSHENFKEIQSKSQTSDSNVWSLQGAAVSFYTRSSCARTWLGNISSTNGISYHRAARPKEVLDYLFVAYLLLNTLHILILTGYGVTGWFIRWIRYLRLAALLVPLDYTKSMKNLYIDENRWKLTSLISNNNITTICNSAIAIPKNVDEIFLHWYIAS